MANYIKKSNEAYERNPWENNLALTMKTGNKIRHISKGNSIVDIDTGEVLDETSSMVTRELIDREEFIKIFELGLTGMFDLSLTARDMFKLVLKIYLEQKMEGKRVYLSDRSIKDGGYLKSRTTKRNALNQLIQAGFIARVTEEPNWYWINPQMFYKGNRMTIIKDYAVIGTSEGDRLTRVIEGKEDTRNKEIKEEQQELPL